MKKFVWLKEGISPAFLIIGAVIGAGFASGRELRSFFAVHGAVSLFVVPLIFLLLLFGCRAFFAMGREFCPQSFSDISRRVFSKGAVFFDFLMALSNLVFIAGMLAAFDSLGQNLLGLGKHNPAISLSALIVCCVLIISGVKNLSKLNNILVPIIIVFLVGVCFFSVRGGERITLDVSQANTSRLVLNGILFVFSNLFTCAGVLYDLGKNHSKKALNFASFLSGVCLSGIMLLFILAFLTSPPAIVSADMPVFFMSKILGGIFERLAIVVLAFSIFTTLIINMLNLYNFIGKGEKSGNLTLIIISVLAFCLRSLGFNIIIDYVYVYIGACGAVFSAGNFAYLFVYAKRKKQHG